jgi:hypothetical protein
MNTEQRITYLNKEMTSGKKLSLVCKEIGIADNVTTEFRKKGYIRNEEGLFIKQEQQHPGPMSLEQLPKATAEQEVAVSIHNEPQESLDANDDVITPPIKDGATTESHVLIGQAVESSPKDGETFPAQEQIEVVETTSQAQDGTLQPLEFEVSTIPQNEIQTTGPRLVTHGRDISQKITEPTSRLGENIPSIKKVGRPPREGEKPKKLTIEIDPAVYKALMHYKIDEGLYVNAYIEDLLRANVPGKYFVI